MYNGGSCERELQFWSNERLKRWNGDFMHNEGSCETELQFWRNERLEDGMETSCIMEVHVRRSSNFGAMRDWKMEWRLHVLWRFT